MKSWRWLPLAVFFLLTACGGEGDYGDGLPTGDTSVGGKRGELYTALQQKKCDKAQDLLDAAGKDVPARDVYRAGIANCRGNRAEARKILHEYQQDVDSGKSPSFAAPDESAPGLYSVWFECYLIQEVEGGAVGDCPEPPPAKSPQTEDEETGTPTEEPTRTTESTRTADPEPTQDTPSEPEHPEPQGPGPEGT
ncbi:hypothetical protein GCM10022221_28540 [Actinocorallia aurea]